MKKIISEYFPKNNVFSLISVFFFVFGLTLFVAIIYTTTGRGIIVNIICGFLFIVAGFGSMFITKNSSDNKLSKK